MRQQITNTRSNLFGNHLFIFSPHPDLNLHQITPILLIHSCPSLFLCLFPQNRFSLLKLFQVIHKLRLKKSPGHNQITNKIAKFLPKKSFLFLTHIYNATLRLSHFPLTRKHSVIIIISNPNKPKHLTSSYCLINLLPIFAKLFEKLILHRITPLINQQYITKIKIRFLWQTTQSIKTIELQIKSQPPLRPSNNTLGYFQIYPRLIDRVWHDGLLFKLPHFLPHYII